MSEPIRVLHCVVNMNRGGAETLIMNIYRNIDRSNIQFDFLTSMEGVFDDEIKSLGGRVYRIPYITKSGPFKYAKDVYQFFKDHGYSIVHSHMDRMSGLMMRESKRAGVPVRIAHSHSTQSEGSRFTKVIKKYYSRYLKDATNFFACSEAAAEFMFPNMNVSVLKNGVDTGKFTYSESIREEQRKKYKLGNQMVIGHVGRFNKPKNHTFLIDIFNEIHKLDRDAVLVMVGQGELKESIENKVKALGLQNNVMFLGSCGNVNEILQMFDIFVLPSLFEGLGIVLIEAQAAGLKCFASDTVPSEADITGNVDFLSIEKSAKLWADVIAKEKNKQERRDMSDIIKRAGYDIHSTAKLLEEYYLNEYKR